MGVVIVWILLAVLCGALAPQKNRSGVGWFFVALLLSPLIALIALAIVKPLVETEETPSSGKAWKCPQCGYWNRAADDKCDNVWCKYVRLTETETVT